MSEAMLAARPAKEQISFIGSGMFLNDLLPSPTNPRHHSRPDSAWLAEPMECAKDVYWYLHGFRTGRGDERHDAPPLWQLRNRRAWQRGRREGVKYL